MRGGLSMPARRTAPARLRAAIKAVNIPTTIIQRFGGVAMIQPIAARCRTAKNNDSSATRELSKRTNEALSPLPCHNSLRMKSRMDPGKRV
jgi:hypothetical protein